MFDVSPTLPHMSNTQNMPMWACFACSLPHFPPQHLERDFGSHSRCWLATHCQPSLSPSALLAPTPTPQPSASMSPRLTHPSCRTQQTRPQGVFVVFGLFPIVEHAKGVVVMFDTFLTPTFTPNMSNTPLGACSASSTAPFPFPSMPTLKTRHLRRVLGVVLATLHLLHPNTKNATVVSRFSC